MPVSGEPDFFAQPIGANSAEEAGRTQAPTRPPFWRTPEAGVAAALTVVVFGLSAWVGGSDAHLVREMHQHLGGEYYNIARALADGRGYSDPFGERTGPTAWMPPLYSFLIAALLMVTKSRAITGAAVLALTNLSLVAIGTTAYAIARRTRLRLSPLFAVGFFVLWIVAFSYWMLLTTHDVWLISLEANLVVIAIARYRMTNRMNPSIWGLLGGAIALTSPALAFGWAAVVLLFALRSREHWRKWVAAGALAAALVTPWIARNAIVFHAFIPVKSNLFFDLYQANYVDDDGIWDQKSMAMHPYASYNLRFKYAEWGESGFQEQYRALFRSAFQSRPEELYRRIANRAAAASVIYTPHDIGSESTVGLALERLVYPLPLLALLGAVGLGRGHRRLLIPLALLWGAYLLPYVIVGFYTRYLLPLTPVLVLAFYLGIDQIVWRFFGEKARA